MQFGQNLERSLAFGVVEDVRRHHQLVGAGAADEILDPAPHRVRAADHGAGEPVIEDRAGVGIEPRLEILDRRRQPAAPPGAVVQHRLLQ